MSIESDGDGSRIADSPSVGAVCQLLGINPEDLRKAICTRTIDAAGEKTQVQQTAEKASASLVALTKALYSRLFKYLVMRLNQRLHNDSFRCTIAVLDIFGFEHFQANFFEQFCINYANEKLQQHFNQYNFTLEQKEYDKEGIPWSNSDFVDNALCLELIEKKPGGVLSILDEECIMPQGADETFLEKLTKHAVDQAKNPHFRTTKNRRQQFIIVHYAGEVTYTVQGFLEKNKDELQPQVVDMMRAAGFAFVPELFAEAAGAKVAGGKRASSLMFDSITFQFKTQLAQLMEAINKTDPHFVRCVNPNGQKKPRVFDKLNVLKQLRCGGVIEAVRMARERYPCRYLHDLFLFTYGCLAPQIQQSGGDVKSMTGRLVQELQIPSEQWKMGKTKIFLRREVIDVLDKRRAQLVGKYALKIQKRARQYVAAKKVQWLMRTRPAAQLIQRATKRAVQQNFCIGRVQQIRVVKLAREREMMAKAKQQKKQMAAAATDGAHIEANLYGMMSAPTDEYQNLDEVAELPVVREQRGGDISERESVLVMSTAGPTTHTSYGSFTTYGSTGTMMTRDPTVWNQDEFIGVDDMSQGGSDSLPSLEENNRRTEVSDFCSNPSTYLT